MRWHPCETWIWESPHSIPELRQRLAGACRRSGGRPADFAGSTSDAGFRLTPVLWGQTSFLPHIAGRWETSAAGTRLRVEATPSPALLLGLVVLFAFLGLLVYDESWPRVALLTTACAASAWLWLQVAHGLGAETAARRLQRLCDAVPAAAPATFETAPPARRAASWLAAIVVVVAGSWLWEGLYAGRFALTNRPAVDLAYVHLGTQALLAAWLFSLAPLAPSGRFRGLMLCFLLAIAWTWSVVVDGFAGDGRPILAWRWTHAARLDPPPLPRPPAERAVDLAVVGPHDFAEFRGPRRDGVVADFRLDPDWERSPPVVVWRQPVRAGWSAFAAAGEFAVTQEQQGDDEVVVCFDLADGARCWEHRDPAHFQELMGGDGPRATPTIHAGRVYTLGATGLLNCLDGRDGRALWTVDVRRETGAPAALFGLVGSPLIWRDLVIVAPGGPRSSLVAYERATGRRVWGAGSAAAGYASPQRATFGGIEQILCFHAEGLTSHAAATGQVLWGLSWLTPPERNNVCQPVVWGDAEGRATVCVSSGYGQGIGLFEISATAEGFAVAPRWRNRNLQAKFTSLVERDGYVYGLDNMLLCCVDLRTGRRCWKGGRYGFGQVLLLGRHLVVATDDGALVLCEATPAAHVELARFPVLHGRTWTHPTLAGDRLLLRNDREAACVCLPTRP